MDPTKPPAGFFDANRYRLFARFVQRDKDGSISLDTRAWNYAVERGELVGECRKCGYKLKPLPTEMVHGTAWYVARCVNCHYEIAAPNGLLLRRSSRHNEQPKPGGHS